MTERTTYKLQFYGLLVAVFGVMLFGWWQGSGGAALAIPGARLVAIGRLFGLIATICILLEVFLMARIPFMESAFDLHDYVDLHRLNGYGILLGIVGHVVFLVLGYSGPTHVGLWQQFWDFNTNYEDVLKASIGTVVFFGATALSVKLLRSKLRYEYWYYSHLTMYGAILLTFMHQIKIGNDLINHKWFLAYWFALYIGTFGLLGYYRFVRQGVLWWKHRFVVDRIVRESDAVFSVYVTGKDLQQLDYQPGQYANWRVVMPNMILEAHPYSYSSIPGSSFVRFSVSSEGGDFGEKLRKLRPGTPLLMDGPRGAFIASRATQQRIVLVAGGVGVAPYMSTIKGFLDEGREVILAYAARNRSDIAFTSELQELVKRGLVVRAYISNGGTRMTPEAIHQLGTSTVYLCGPDRLTKAFKHGLRALGHRPSDIISEEFAY